MMRLPVVFALIAATIASLPTFATSSNGATLEWVESFPLETTLDNPDLREAHDVWIEMIDAATSSLDFAEFYVSNQPDSRLEAVIQAVERAAVRGVAVRFLADKKFYGIYPKTLDRLDSAEGIEVRIYDAGEVMGGVLHAKYFVVDAGTIYVGSQNFDWRALEHIQELGARLEDKQVASAFLDMFEADWRTAAGDPTPVPPRVSARAFPIAATVSSGDTVRVTPALSPRDHLPEGALWDLPQILELLDSATDRVQLQLLTYKAVGRNKRYFAELESALRDAAARGCEVQLLLANWCQRAGTIEGLQSLEPIPGIDIRLVTIPEWSGGFIPFARVTHAKYLVVDEERAWIGTSNWERGYFFDSRNAGLILEGKAAGERLADYFTRGWDSQYAKPVDACAHYEAPRVAE